MRTKNAVSLIGMVGNEVEVRQTSGVSYARFSLATSSGGYTKNDGTQVPEKTQWHNIVVWRNLAVFAGKWVRKGQKVAVDGMITYGEYTDKKGQKVRTVEILANDIVLMSAQQTNLSQQSAPQRQQQNSMNGGFQDDSFPPPLTDGVPF